MLPLFYEFFCSLFTTLVCVILHTASALFNTNYLNPGISLIEEWDHNIAVGTSIFVCLTLKKYFLGKLPFCTCETPNPIRPLHPLITLRTVFSSKNVDLSNKIVLAAVQKDEATWRKHILIFALPVLMALWESLLEGGTE